MYVSTRPRVIVLGATLVGLIAAVNIVAALMKADRGPFRLTPDTKVAALAGNVEGGTHARE